LLFSKLSRTQNEACCRAHIPAKKVSGDSSEDQILVAGHHYLDRPLVLESVLNDLFHIFRYENCKDVKSALDIILLAMDKHPGEKVSRTIRKLLRINLQTFLFHICYISKPR
jgi:Zyg-11 family protein